MCGFMAPWSCGVVPFTRRRRGEIIEIGIKLADVPDATVINPEGFRHKATPDKFVKLCRANADIQRGLHTVKTAAGRCRGDYSVWFDMVRHFKCFDRGTVAKTGGAAFSLCPKWLPERLETPLRLTFRGF